MHKAMIKELAKLMLVATLAMTGAAGAAQFTTTGTDATACAGDVTIEATGVVKCTEGGTTLLPSCTGDVVIDTTGAIRCSSDVSASAPKCTLAASPTSVAAGGSSTLTATCSPVATSYAWTLGNGSTQTTTTNKLSVKPTSTSTYTVKGTNASGQGAAASATVTVGGATTGVPVCSLSVSAGFSVGQILVQASCNPAATSYTWTNTGFASTAPSGYLTTPTTTTTYSVIGRNAYGSSTQKSATWTVSKPSCTLTASPSTIAPEPLESSTLTVSCSPAATSFAWHGGACEGTTSATCIVSLPSGSQTYRVTGTNTGGTSAEASATVTVAKPNCTLTASPSSIAPNGSSTLTASCSPKAASYAWTGGTCAGKTTNSCTVTLASGSQPYTVTGTNTAGTSTASATVTVAPPSCTLTAAPSSIAPNASSTLTANCSPAATSIAWTGGTCAGNTTNSCTVTLASGSQAYTVTGTNAAGPGSPASATVTVIVPGTCTLSNTNVKVAWGKDFGGNLNTKMSRGQSVSFEFTTPPLNYWSTGVLTRTAGSACTVKGSVAGSLYCNGATWITPAVGAACTGTGTAEGLTCSAGYWAANVTPVLGAACTEAGNAAASGSLYCNGATWVTPVKYTECTVGSAAGGYTCTTGKTGSILKEISTIGTLVKTFMHVSTTQCDFTYPTNWTSAWDGCSQSAGISSLKYILEATDTHTFGHCSLKPNTKYYANTRNEYAMDPAYQGIDTCPAGKTCGFLFNMK